MGHNKFNKGEAEGGATTALAAAARGSTRTSAGNQRTSAGNQTRFKTLSIFGTPIEVLSKSKVFSSSIATYDPSLAPPTAILRLLRIVEEDIDAAGIFHEKVNSVPDDDLLERLETAGEMSGEQGEVAKFKVIDSS